MTCSTGSGGESRRTGRGQAGQFAVSAERTGAADAALGQVAFHRAEAVDGGARRGGTASRSIERREIGRRRLAGHFAGDRLRARAARRAPATRRSALDAEAGLDRLDLRAQQLCEMGAVAGGAGGADRSRIAPSSSTRSQSEDEAADAEARLRQGSRTSRRTASAERLRDRLGAWRSAR